MSASPTKTSKSEPRGRRGSASKSYTTSQNFNAADADVIFESSDNVRFHLHRRNLETHTDIFPAAELVPSGPGDIATLTEDSSTLEHLFHYIYPQRHPDIDLLLPEDFFKLAEAAQKYQIFTLMDLCHKHMKQILAHHPAEAFYHGSRHGYLDILNLAAPFMMDFPLDEVMTKLPTNLVVPWVRYSDCWRRAVDQAISKYSTSSKIFRCANVKKCNFVLGSTHLKLRLAQPLSRKSLDGLLKSSFPSFVACPECPMCGSHFAPFVDYEEDLEGVDEFELYKYPRYEEASQQLDRALEAVPDFSTFI